MNLDAYTDINPKVGERPVNFRKTETRPDATENLTIAEMIMRSEAAIRGIPTMSQRALKQSAELD